MMAAIVARNSDDGHPQHEFRYSPRKFLSNHLHYFLTLTAFFLILLIVDNQPYPLVTRIIGVNRITFAYLCGMFVRQRKNKSGTISVVAVDNTGCQVKELKTIGVLLISRGTISFGTECLTLD